MAIAVTLSSQVPQAFNYQAIIRNSDGTEKADQAVSISVAIIQGSFDGFSIYEEVHSSTTNSLGLVTINIGLGTSSQIFDDIDWSQGPYFIDITVDGVHMGASQLLSVPYALHSGTVDSITETDPGFNEWDKSTGVSITASQVSDFQTSVTNNSEVLANTAKQSYPTEDATKLAGIEEGAEVNVNADWSAVSGDAQVLNKPALATVATSGSFTDLTNIPTTIDGYGITDAANKAYVDGLQSQISMLKNSMTAYGIIRDNDNNVYNTVRIGDQVWMAENLKTTKYNDGTPIPLVTLESEWGAITTPAYCWYGNDETTYKNKYGALYSWYAVNTGNLCNTGWHVPTDAEWTTLADYLINNGYGYEGSGDDIAKSMAAILDWLPNGTGGNIGNDPASNNSSGFTALPGGYRGDESNGFSALGLFGYWWSATTNSTTNAWYRNLSWGYSRLVRNDYISTSNNTKQSGFSVRCIKDP